MQLLDQANTPLGTSNPRGGVDVQFDLSSNEPLQQSPTWRAAQRELRFIRLAPHRSLALPSGRHFVKVIAGRLDNIQRTCLAAPYEVRSTRIDVSKLNAGDDGVLFALATMDDDAPVVVDDIALLHFEGVHGDRLGWRRFDEKFAGMIDFFDGKDCHMANGLHLLDEVGREVVYVNPWACGKGVDLSTHDHGHPPSPLAPAFAEVHWVLSVATPESGMYRASAPDGVERTRYPMQLGDEHGPFYDRDRDGRPLMKSNGAVQYPWHGWQSGDDDRPERAYDFVLAFEVNPQMIEARR